MNRYKSKKLWFDNDLSCQRRYLSMAVIIAALTCTKSIAQEAISFTDIAKQPNSGIDYQRTPSAREALWAAIRSKPVVSIFDFGTAGPLRARGTPGVALFDYDMDGDLDIYVTNGPGTANSLYSNQWAESNTLHFVDVASNAGVQATEFDGTGVCYGDTDNDGDHDLYVLSAGDKNAFYVNNGNATFTDVTSNSEVGGKVSYSSGCSMGDVNGDGLLDIVIANTVVSWDNPLQPTDHNQLLINKGNNLFEDRTEHSGITELAGFLDEQTGTGGLTWAIAMVDYDLDSDIDILMVDDQSAYPVGDVDGVLGFIHVMQNDGTGHFTDKTVEAGTNINGAWMGLAFGDINFDGLMDMFVSNIGDYMNAQYFPYQIGDRASRWFLGQADASFAQQEINNSNATTFGWGTVMTDYDNDGDTDIVYHGSMDGGALLDASNPGIVMANDGNGNMAVDINPLAESGHLRRNIQGLAQGDVNKDGFIDLVSVSNMDIPESVPLAPYTTQWGSDLDATAYFVPTYTPVGPLQFTWNGYEFDNGTLAIDVNSANNGNGSVAIELLGTVGILAASKSNRDGIGATIRFTPKAGKTAMRPIVAGDSYASQNSLTAHFGLGQARKGTAEVLWPGGTKNRVYNVKEGETVRIPEIPCSFDADWANLREYKQCVYTSLQNLVNNGLIDRSEKPRLYLSAIKAYLDSTQGQLAHSTKKGVNK